MKTETRSETGFDSIHVGGNFEVEVKVGSKESITVEAQENLLKEIKTHTDGSVLKIESEYNLRSDQPIKVTITTPKLQEMNVSGAARAKVEGASGDRFSLTASGAGRVKLAGTVDDLTIEESGASEVVYEGFRGKSMKANLSGGSTFLTSGDVSDLTIELSGASQFKGENLKSERAEIDASGGCQAAINAKETLTGTVSGASSVRYSGTARPTVTTNGASTLSKVP